MSKRETRISKAWSIFYRNILKKQRGVIVFGRGLNAVNAMNEASKDFHVYNHGDHATLH